MSEFDTVKPWFKKMMSEAGLCDECIGKVAAWMESEERFAREVEKEEIVEAVRSGSLMEGRSALDRIRGLMGGDR